MLRESGLLDVQVHPVVHVYPREHPRRMLVLEFVENARARLVENGLTTEAEVDALVAALRQHLEHPATLVVSSLVIQTWGRKPLPQSVPPRSPSDVT